MYENIPAELKELPQWVCSGANKLPLTPSTGETASVTDPATWGTFEEARQAGYLFVGFVLAPWDPYCIIDLDNKPDKPLTEEQWGRHQKILSSFDSYTERSAGGQGYHIIIKGKLPAGVHRDCVEAYSSGRYMICTGNVVNASPIKERQELLDILYGEMAPLASIALEENEERWSDKEIVDMAMQASNGAKFNRLCNGDQSDYPSQSEADFALLSILSFYSNSNEQVRRIFRMTGLGKREKAIKNNTYLDYALGKIRAKQPGPVNVQDLIQQATSITQPKPAPKSPGKEESLSLPPGLIGDLAKYYYQTAIRPVQEIALASAIATVAGVCGRSYNISGTGLNQYLILLAKTGSGKEGASTGLENLIAAVRPTVPMVDQFIGPAAFASGQALIKVLNEKPCFVSVLGEFGLTLQQISDHRANSAMVMLRRVLLDLYAKSGWNRTLRSSVYSDTDKNTKIIQAPNVTILGESTPETFFDGLDISHIEEGLIPRFTIIEYSGKRPPRNRTANHKPPEELVTRFVDLVTTSLTSQNNLNCTPVHLESDAQNQLDEFDVEADKKLNSTGHDIEVQLWNRAHLKALKMAGLLAVGVNPHQPTVSKEMAQWAINFIRRDIKHVSIRFRDGDVGKGDSKQFNDLQRIIQNYFEGNSALVAQRGKFNLLFRNGVVPYAYLFQRAANMASFKNHRLGAKHALQQSLQAMLDSGMLVELSRQQLKEEMKFSGVGYGLGSNWQE